jgi:hypothetical protein
MDSMAAFTSASLGVAGLGDASVSVVVVSGVVVGAASVLMVLLWVGL